MINKRFVCGFTFPINSVEDPVPIITDTEKNKHYILFSEIVDTLNELQEEIKQLQKENKRFKKQKKISSEINDMLNELQRENEQLRKENKKLKNQNTKYKKDPIDYESKNKCIVGLDKGVPL